jgi:hypothetical protein
MQFRKISLHDLVSAVSAHSIIGSTFFEETKFRPSWHWCTNPRHHVAVVKKFYTVVPNTCPL